MTQQLRRTIVVEILGEEVSIDVTFRLIEFIERAFDTSADHAIALFVKAGGVQRRRVADVIADAIIRTTPSKWARDTIREAVITCSMDEYAQHVAALQSALLFLLKRIDAETFDTVKDEIAESRKKKPPTPTAASSPAATP